MNRQMKLKTILLTGITGNLGAFAALRFLECGHKVYAIVRSKKGLDCAKRAGKNLRQYCDAESGALGNLHGLEVLEGNIADHESLASIRIPEKIDETWHFASSLKYMPKERDEIFGINLNGLTNMMGLHRGCQNKGGRFFYISTAYVGGKHLSEVPEARIVCDENIFPNNYYERSKMLAENMFLDALAKNSLEGAIFRPSIVIGDSKAGKLLHYTGPYQVARTWHCLSAAMRQLGGRDRFVRVAANLEHSLNLIPIDMATDMMIELSNNDLGDAFVFNVVNKKEVHLQNAFGAISRCTGFPAILCDPNELRRSPKSIYEKLVSYSLDYISPYVSNKVGFETTNVEKILKRESSFDVYPDLYTRSIAAYVASLSDVQSAAHEEKAA